MWKACLDMWLDKFFNNPIFYIDYDIITGLGLYQKGLNQQR